MATLKQKIETEAMARRLLAENGMPEPDGVEYGHTCIRLFFEEPKTVLIIDIDPPPGEGDDGDQAEGGYFVDIEGPGDDFATDPLDGLGGDDAIWN